MDLLFAGWSQGVTPLCKLAGPLNGGTHVEQVKVSQIAEVTITGLSHDGRGVGRVDGRVVFVSDVLPGERALVRLSAPSKGVIQGTCVQRLNDSPDRRRPPCILAERCGGCSLQHLDYPAQLSGKHQVLADTLTRIGHLEQQPQSLLANGRELGYRNRAVIPLERTADGHLRAGYYRQGSHRIVNMNHCPVLDPRLDRLIGPLKTDLERSDWPVDRHLQAEGGLRHLALRLAHHSGEVLITLISSHDDLPGCQELAQHWLQRWPELVGVVLNLQTRPTNTLFGPDNQLLAGRDWLQEQFCGLAFAVGPDTFFQVNTAQAEALVPLMVDAVAGVDQPLIDAYCGIGAFSLPLAAAGHRVVGLEVQAAAIDLARRNAIDNGLEAMARFELGPVAQNLAAQLAGAGAVLVDPPRKGLEVPVREALLQQPVERLLYLSCDAATLARDLAALCSGGVYRLERLQPADFFPNTSHVETLAVLSS